MKAAIFKGIGGVEQLEVKDIPIPAIGKDEILVKTKVASINTIEVKTRNGNRFSEPLLEHKHPILGWDANRAVKKAGENMTAFNSGDKVFRIIACPMYGKTYAEYFVAKEKHKTHIPETVSFADAA